MIQTTITQNSDLFQANSQYVLPQHPGNFNTIEIEQEIIGGLLLDPNAIGRIYDDLDPKYFSIYFYQDIINCIKDLHRQDKTPDLITVTLELKQRNKITDGSEQVAIATIAARTVCAVNIDQHLQTLIENYNRSDYFDNGKLKPSVALSRIKEYYCSDRDEEQLVLDLYDLQQEVGMSDTKWNNFIRATTRKCKKERYKLELKRLAAITDESEQSIEIDEIAQIYNKSRRVIKEDIGLLNSQSLLPPTKDCSLTSFLELETHAVDWIYPGLLPRGELLLLAAQAKCGKTLFATDIMYSVVTGTALHGNTIPKGRVLYYWSDEPSKRSVQRRLTNRGFDVLDKSIQQDMKLYRNLQLNNLQQLEEQLKTFGPTLVVIDSLTSIAADIGVSENDSAYAKYIYKLGELLGKYGAAGILIHHENKNSEQKGIDRVAGSGRISAAVWGIAQMKAAKPGDPSCTERWLSVTPREGARHTNIYQLNPKDLWSEKGIFEFLHEQGDENNQNRTHGEKVLELLNTHKGKGLEYKEIDNLLGIGRTLYSVLDRLEDKQLITRRRSKTDKRRWVYLVPDNTSSPTEKNKGGGVSKSADLVELNTESIDSNKLESIQPLVSKPQNLASKSEVTELNLEVAEYPESIDKSESQEINSVTQPKSDTPPLIFSDTTAQEDVAQNPTRQNTSNNVNGQEDFKVGDRVIELGSGEQFVIVEVIKNSPYPDGQYIIENERKLPEKIRGFALEKID